MLAFQLLAATSAYLLPSHLHVCTPARQHPLRTAPLRMNSEWSASDEVRHAAARTPQRALPRRLPPATPITAAWKRSFDARLSTCAAVAVLAKVCIRGRAEYPPSRTTRFSFIRGNPILTD
jgi:hypothetical protein